jgi:transposase
MRRSRRSFSPEFKQEAVRLLIEAGQSLSSVSRDLELDPKMLRRWRREYEQEGRDAFPGQGRQRADLEEFRRLQREVERLKMEREILKKALTIFSEVDGPRR